MSAALDIAYDRPLIEDIAARFGLRSNNIDALDALIRALCDDFEKAVPLVMDMATGSGKTYLMAALIDYLRAYGVTNVMIVTPSLVVQTKTVQNFSFGAKRFIAGSEADTTVVTPGDYGEWTADGSAATLFHRGRHMHLFVFNVQQLLAPSNPDSSTVGDSASARQTRIRRFMESAGNLFEYLRDAEDLVVIADEHHLYGPSAIAFRQAITDLQPAAVVGLTASASRDDQVVFRYPLWKAIADGHVKRPVLAFRKGGYGPLGEEQQLRDALTLLRSKASAYGAFNASRPERPDVHPVLFVVCTDVVHATATAELLRSPDMLGSGSAVLQVDNAHNDAATQKALEDLDTPDSPVRAVVSVNKLKEGWDVRNIAVMVTLRAMTSDVLTQQTMGRGLRLPYGELTGISAIDELDIVGHDSFHKLLTEENVLRSFGLEAAAKPNFTPRKVAVAGTPNGSTPHPEGTPTVELEAGSRDLMTGGQRPGARGRGEAADLPDDDRAEDWDFGGIRATVIDDDVTIGASTVDDDHASVTINPAFAGTVILFPRSTMTRADAPFDLVDVTDTALAEAAGRIAGSTATMEREEIVTTTVRKHMRLDTRAVEQADVESLPVATGDVAAALVDVARNSALVERTGSNIAQIKNRIVPRLMASAGISQWTEVTALSAATVLRGVLKDAATEHTKSLKTIVTVHPHRLPTAETYLLPEGESVHARIDRKGRAAFVRRRHYGGWTKGLFPAASFDSYSAEYRIAELLNKAGNIEWWMRLYDRDQAEIAFRINRVYRPDFIARDSDGVNWIIEGKNAAGRVDEEVQDKRRAAEALIRRLVGLEEFGDQRWGYLVAYDDTVGQVNSWSQLRDSSEPITQIRIE